jgi:hypothetical protein
MGNWTPSIVPGGGVGQDFCFVMEDLGRLGLVFLEADIARANFETVIADMLDGQYAGPVSVVSFNTIKGWSRDISEKVAGEIRRRCDLQGREIPASIRDFVESHEGRSRQLTLRLG